MTAHLNTVEQDSSVKIRDDLIEVIRIAAIDAPTWHLTPELRWQLLRDTLLGHVAVRGRIRPRDLPLDASCQALIDVAATISNLPPYACSVGKIQFRHWLTIFSLLPLAKSQACDGSPLSDDDRLCATILELCFATGMKAGDVAKSPFIHRLIGALGLSQQEWKHLVDKYEETIKNKTKPPFHDALLARWAARVIAMAEPPKASDFAIRGEWRSSLARKLSQHEGQGPEIARFLAALDERSCCYATLKADRPQQYINQGTRHWLLRGASGWCSQSLALARDLMCDDDSLLLSDSDAIAGIWFPRTASERELQDRLNRKLDEFWRLEDGSDMDDRFPRLRAWLWENLPAKAGLDRHKNLPVLSVRCLAPMSVLEICLYRITKEAKEAKEEGKEVSLPASTEEVVTDGTCARVLGDVAVGFKANPPWLQDESGDRPKNRADGDEEKAPKVGITSMIWALCGTAFRTHAHEGLCTALANPRLQLQAVKHGDWLQQLGMPTESLVHLKIDGDGVGERFRASSLADFPSLSMQLARMVQRRLVAGVRASLHELSGHGAGTELTLPIDVVYVGGDDVYVILPQKVLDSFLRGFSGTVPELAGTPWEKTGFTFVAARLKPREELLAGVEEGQGGAGSPGSNRFAAANLAAARLVTEGLSHIKKVFKGEVTFDPGAIQNPINQALSRKSGLEEHQMTATADPSAEHFGCLLDDGRRLLRGSIFLIGPATPPQ